MPVVPCYRCYIYKHIKKNCPKGEQYKICSICATEGHVHTECKAITQKCINCHQNHRTLAAKFPERKTIIRNKIKERKARLQSLQREIPPTQVVPDIHICKHPENCLAVMAATITLTDKREAEVPGIYNYIVSEMLKANNVSEFRFPDTVISGYKAGEGDKIKGKERKRQRSLEEQQYQQISQLEQCPDTNIE